MKKNSEFAQKMQEKKMIEKEKLKTMKFREKVDYIWTYYKVPIIAVVLTAAFIISIVHNIVTSKESIMATIALNTNIMDFSEDENGQPTLFTDFLNEAGYDPDKFQIDANTTLMFSNSEDPASSNPREYSVLTTLLMTGTMDNILADKNTFDTIARGGSLMPLSDYLTKDELETYKDQLVYATDSESSESRAFGIRLDNSPALLDSKMFYETPIFGMINGTIHQDVSVDFLHYLLKE